MRFFRLTHPPYSTDTEYARNNPVRAVVGNTWIPGMLCDFCGGRGSSSFLRVEVQNDNNLTALLGGQSLYSEEWHHAVRTISARLGVPAENLEPGMCVGLPIGEIWAPTDSDFVFPQPGLIWVTRRVMELFQIRNIRGVDYCKVVLRPTRDLDDCTTNNVAQFDDSISATVTKAIPEFWELIIHGRAWKVGATAKNIIQCNYCGKRAPFDFSSIRIDEDRWNRSDFCIVNENPSAVVITGQVHDLLAASRFTNWRCLGIN